MSSWHYTAFNCSVCDLNMRDRLLSRTIYQQQNLISASGGDFIAMHRLVHLDLKGAPPNLGYLEKLLPYLKKCGTTGLLIEYEDKFPYQGDLRYLAHPDAYSVTDIQDILQLSANSQLLVVPLVQTFGHLEFVLKHDSFRHLREVEMYPNALCPSIADSLNVVLSMVDQVIDLHPNIRWFHIGSDEVWHMAECIRCQARLENNSWTKEDLFCSHVASVARHVRTRRPELIPIMWDDMLRSFDRRQLQVSTLGSLVEPMVWHYSAMDFQLPQGLWEKYSSVFAKIWVASAFKGATGSTQCVTNIHHHLENQLRWLQVMDEQKSKFETFRGVALTGWQRYDHYAVLCELIPVAIPSLVFCLQTLIAGGFNETIHATATKLLGTAENLELESWPRPRQQPLDLKFPACELFITVNRFIDQLDLFHKLTNSESFKGWFSSYNITCRYANPLHVGPISSQANNIHQNLSYLQNQLKFQIQSTFGDRTAKEWMLQYVDPTLQQLDEIRDNCAKLLSIGTSTQPQLPIS